MEFYQEKNLKKQDKLKGEIIPNQHFVISSRGAILSLQRIKTLPYHRLFWDCDSKSSDVLKVTPTFNP